MVQGALCLCLPCSEKRIWQEPFSCSSVRKASAYNAGNLSSYSSGRKIPGEGNGNPLQDSCLENPMDGGAWWAAVHGVVKSWTRLSDFPFTFHFHALEKEMATHSSVLAWRIPGTGEPGGLPSMGSHRVGHDWSDLAAAAAANVLAWRIPTDRGDWRASVHGVARVGHDLATKPPPPPPLLVLWKSM